MKPTLVYNILFFLDSAHWKKLNPCITGLSAKNSMMFSQKDEERIKPGLVSVKISKLKLMKQDFCITSD